MQCNGVLFIFQIQETKYIYFQEIGEKDEVNQSTIAGKEYSITDRKIQITDATAELLDPELNKFQQSRESKQFIGLQKSSDVYSKANGQFKIDNKQFYETSNSPLGFLNSSSCPKEYLQKINNETISMEISVKHETIKEKEIDQPNIQQGDNQLQNINPTIEYPHSIRKQIDLV